ncbi:MAG: glycosyltransferase family A protein [Rikenellaceae bacterium]
MISIIIPLYNKAPYVEKAVRSVLSQRYSDYELIIVNDGSTDGSLLVVQQLVEEVQRDNIRVIDQANSGVAMARNNGVVAAKGDYISFLDADDWWSADYLDQMVEVIKNYPEAGIYGCGYYIVKNGRERVAQIGVESGFESGLINYCKVYATTLYMPLTSITVIIKKKVFNEFGGFKPHLKLGEDFDLWIRVALKYPVALLNRQLAYYNQDVDLKSRAVGRLHDPKTHMLWNLDYLSEEESKNPDYKY